MYGLVVGGGRPKKQQNTTSEVKRQQLTEHGKIQHLNVWFGGEGKGPKKPNKTTKHKSQHLHEALKAQEKGLAMPMAPTFLFLRNSI